MQKERRRTAKAVGVSQLEIWAQVGLRAEEAREAERGERTAERVTLYENVDERTDERERQEEDALQPRAGSCRRSSWSASCAARHGGACARASLHGSPMVSAPFHTCKELKGRTVAVSAAATVVVRDKDCARTTQPMLASRRANARLW